MTVNRNLIVSKCFWPKIMFCLGLAGLFLFPVMLLGHGLGVTEAKINIYANGKYELKILSDIFNFAAEEFNISDKQDLQKLAQMGEKDIAAHLNAAEARFLEQFSLQSDQGRSIPIEKVLFLTVGRVQKALARIQQKDQHMVSSVVLEGHLPESTHSLKFRFPESLGEVSLGIVQNDHRLVSAAKWSPSIPLTGANDDVSNHFFKIAWSYVLLGFEHIVPKGADHILFVLGLFLFHTALPSLLWQTALFTLAHSITLALSIYDVFFLPATLVEPLISLSIVFIALENIVTQKLKLRRSLVIFGFGLLHGLGFAEVLHGLGLPQNDYLTALMGFNLGVEFGQVVVILFAFFVLGWSHRYPWHNARVKIPFSLLIGMIGIFWTIERIQKIII